MTAASTSWVPMATDGTVMRNAFAAYSNLLTAVGVAKTADTGQIDLTPSAITPPATAPATAFTLVGYEIRKLEATGKATLYLKVYYGIWASTADTPSTYRAYVYLGIGSSTNGAGVLNGFGNYSLSTPNATIMPAMSTTTRLLYMASDGQNYLSVVHDPAGAASTSYNPYTLAVERSINPLTGTYDSEAAVGYCPFSTTSSSVAIVNFALGVGYQESGNGYVPFCIPGGIFTSSSSLSTATIMPIAQTVPTPKGAPTCMLLAYKPDVAGGGQYPVNMYGQSRTYIAVTNSPISAYVGSPSTYRVLVRYD